jgi:hypothetical protein
MAKRMALTTAHSTRMASKKARLTACWIQMDGSLDMKHGIGDGLLTFDGSEDCIDGGSLDFDGINEGNFDNSLDSDGTYDGSLDFNGTADGNVEDSLDFDVTEDGIVIAVFDRKTQPSSEPSSILKLETEQPAELLPKGTGRHQNLRNRLLAHHRIQVECFFFLLFGYYQSLVQLED